MKGKKDTEVCIVQELKKEAYHIGRVPAARCNVKNYISRLTLMKAGLRPCGFLLLGTVNNVIVSL